MLLIYLGLIITLIGSIGFYICAFKESILWGVGCLIIPPISLIFMVMFWNDVKNSVLLQLLGIGIMILGAIFKAA